MISEAKIENFNHNPLPFRRVRCTENSCQFENLFLTKLTG